MQAQNSLLCFRDVANTMQSLMPMSSVRTAVFWIDAYGMALNSVNNPHDLSSHAKNLETVVSTCIDEMRTIELALEAYC